MAIASAVERVVEPAAAAPHFPVAVIGSGFAGIGVSVALQRAGIEHVILERAEDLGGTWRDNRYPGCQCDVPSHLYSFSFAPNPDWSRTYSPQAEIWDYLRRVADRFGVTPRIRFGHEVLDCAWDGAAKVWRIQTAAGRFTAGAVIAGVGGLSEPIRPDITGLDSFRGDLFHSAAWREDAPLDGKRVAVIGTGASAVQLIPKVQKRAARLLVFQRTPGWVLPHRDRPITDRERRLYRHLPITQRLVRWGVYWLRELLVIGLAKNPSRVEPIRRLALQHLERQVPDPELRAKLVPTFSPGCKRLLPSNDYYPALTQANVELVTDRIREIRGHSIVTADGREREIDVLVAATGFRVTDHPFYERVRGADGRSLAERWETTGSTAYRGTTVSGYPNLFLMGGPNTGLGHTSVVVMLEAQIPYVIGALKLLRTRRLAAVDVRPEAEEEYNRDLQSRLAKTVWNSGGCASWYLDAKGRNTTLWPDFTWKYRLLLRRFDPDAYDLVPPSKAAEQAAPGPMPEAARNERRSGLLS